MFRDVRSRGRSRGEGALFVFFVCALVGMTLAGCSSKNDATSDASVQDASSSGDASTVPAADGAAPDGATADADASFPFSFSLTLSGKKVTFDRGQFGNDKATGSLYLELYDGGDPACPSKNSPTPKHTLIVSGLSTSGASNPTATLLDFVGDVITTPQPSRKASAASATMVHGDAAHIELTLNVTFDGDGTGAGSVTGDHCDSLDD